MGQKNVISMFLVASIALLLFYALPPILAHPTQQAAADHVAIDTYVGAQMDKHGLPGVALAITQGDEIVYLQGYGTAGNGRPLTPQTPLFIGSQSKSVTALAIAQLAEQGKMDLDAPVRTYIPWFSLADGYAAERITIRHLLHHTSGLSEAGFFTVLAEDTPLETAVRALKTAELSAPVGERFQYFNFGYVVLTYIIERVSGQSYADYVEQRIFGPLQMSNTFTDRAVAASRGLAQGYSRFFGFAIPARQPAPVYEVGAGYIMSSAEDMARFAIAMNNEGVYRDSQILSSEWMSHLFAPVQGYGMGWFVEPGRIYHGGANETFKTFFELHPPQGLGLVLLINQGYILDHYLSTQQLMAGVKALTLSQTPPAATAGPSVRTLGWGILALVLALTGLNIWNLVRLRAWPTQAVNWSRGKRAWNVALNFIIPTVILVVVFTQLHSFYGDRFHLGNQLYFMFRNMADITVLMFVATVPDYVQGVVKLFWLLTGRVAGRPNHTDSGAKLAEA